MKSLKIGSALLAGVLFAAGCTITKHEEIEKQAEGTLAEYEALLQTFKNKKSMAVPKSKQLEIETETAWLQKEVTSDYSKMRFRSALKQLFPGTPIVYSMNIPENYDFEVVAPPQAHTVQDHLNSISLQSNLGWSMSGGVLYVSPNSVVHYPIPLYGSGSGGGSGIRSNIKVSSNNLGESNSGGFVNELEGEMSPYDEIASIASSVTGAQACGSQGSAVSPAFYSADPVPASPACYSLSGAGNILVLSARPQQHALFSSAYKPWYKSVNTQVQITLKVLQTDVTDIAQQALDPSILRTAAISAASGLSHFEGLGINAAANSQNFVSFDESANGLTFTFDEGSRYAGSELIIRALNQVGKTFVSKTQEITARNNQVSSFAMNEETPFLESVSITTTSNNNNSSSTAPTLQSNATLTGTAFNIIATVTGNQIGLRIVINEKTLGEREDYEISTEDTFVQGSRYGWTSSDSTFTPTLKDGEVALLVSSERKTFDVSNAKNDLLPFIGDMKSAKGRVFNTLYLIEAHIIR
jgi:hypothetical protein